METSKRRLVTKVKNNFFSDYLLTFNAVLFNAVWRKKHLGWFFSFKLIGNKLSDTLLRGTCLVLFLYCCVFVGQAFPLQIHPVGFSAFFGQDTHTHMYKELGTGPNTEVKSLWWLGG